MEKDIFERVLTAVGIDLGNSVEVDAARILIQAGEALAKGDATSLELIQECLVKTSGKASVMLCILVGAGVLCESIKTASTTGKLEGFDRGWQKGFDRGFLNALKIQSS